MCEKPKLEDDPEPAEDEEKPRSYSRSYYYDDAHGYEDFDPEADVMDADDESLSA